MAGCEGVRYCPAGRCRLESLELLVEGLTKTGVLRPLAGECEGSLGRNHGQRTIAILQLSLERILDL